MRKIVSGELDEVESKLSPRRGKLEIGAYARELFAPDLAVGGYADLQARLTKSIAMFGRADVSYHLAVREIESQLIGGLRVMF